MKKVPFDYEFFKINPDTKLATRSGDEAIFISKASTCKAEHSVLIFETNNLIISTFINGNYLKGKESPKDIFMLIEAKEVVKYFNVYDEDSFPSVISLQNTIKDAIAVSGTKAKSVVKLVFVDGEIDFKKCETVHKY